MVEEVQPRELIRFPQKPLQHTAILVSGREIDRWVRLAPPPHSANLVAESRGDREPARRLAQTPHTVKQAAEQRDGREPARRLAQTPHTVKQVAEQRAFREMMKRPKRPLDMAEQAGPPQADLDKARLPATVAACRAAWPDCPQLAPEVSVQPAVELVLRRLLQALISPVEAQPKAAVAPAPGETDAGALAEKRPEIWVQASVAD